ncbi:MAG: hypothetical protein ACRD0K_28180 [Egibacteraceae bacterium]
MTEPAREPKEPLTFRVHPSTLQRLKHRARETGVGRTALAERYLEEGLRRDDHPLISFREGASGRRAALVGTRLDVWQVIQTVRAAGNSVEDAAAYLELPVEKVRACVRYFADYPEEIDSWAARAASISEREEAIWRRQRELLG